MSPLRIVYCGYHLSGARVLEELLSTPDEFNIVTIWTNKDPVPGPKDYSSVVKIGMQANIPVLIGNPRKDPRFQNSLMDIDLIICVNYRYILPSTILKRLKYGAINIHGSYLPFYRGRTPNTWAIINGEEYSGATVHIINEKVDAGPILVQKKIPIDPLDTGHTLFLKQVAIYPELVRNGIYNLLDPEYLSIIQDESLASEFPARSPENGEINWSWSAWRIYNWIRAQSYPYPGAFTLLRGERVIVWNALFPQESSRLQNTGMPGEIIGATVLANTSGIWIATGSYGIFITSIGLAGKKRLSPYCLVQDEIWAIGDVLGT